MAPVAPRAPVAPGPPLRPVAPVAPVAPVGPKHNRKHQFSKLKTSPVLTGRVAASPRQAGLSYGHQTRPDVSCVCVRACVGINVNTRRNVLLDRSVK